MFCSGSETTSWKVTLNKQIDTCHWMLIISFNENDTIIFMMLLFSTGIIIYQPIHIKQNYLYSYKIWSWVQFTLSSTVRVICVSMHWKYFLIRLKYR